MHDNSMMLMDNFLRLHWRGGMTVLDVGSRQTRDKHRTYRELIPDEMCYTGIDIKAGTNVDKVVEPYRWDIPSRCFDIVISGQVLEHSARFWDLFAEMARVLKVGGVMCVIAPAVASCHKYPADCWRFMPDGMAALGEMAGLRTLSTFISQGKDVTDCVGIFEKRSP